MGSKGEFCKMRLSTAAGQAQNKLQDRRNPIFKKNCCYYLLWKSGRLALCGIPPPRSTRSRVVMTHTAPVWRDQACAPSYFMYHHSDTATKAGATFMHRSLYDHSNGTRWQPVSLHHTPGNPFQGGCGCWNPKEMASMLGEGNRGRNYHSLRSSTSVANQRAAWALELENTWI